MGVGASGFAYIGSHRRSMRLWVINTIEFYSAGLVQQLWGFRALQKLRNGERRGWPDDGVAGGVAVLAGLLRAINKRRCQHPPLDLRLSTLPLSLSFLSTLFFSVFIPLDIFFPSRASPLEKFRRLLLSRTRFNLPCSFSDHLFSFLPLPHFFIRVVPKRFAVLCLCFKIEVHSTFSSWSILRVPAYTLPVSSSFSFFFQFVSLSSEEIPWISLSIFPIDSPTNVLIFIFARRLSRFRIHFPSLRFLPREFSLALCAVTYNTNFCFLFIFLYSFLYSLLCSLLLLVAFNSAAARIDIFRTKKYRKFCATLFH